MSLSIRSITRIAAVLVGLAATVPCQAVTVVYVGTEPGGAGSGYATANWSNPSVPKLYATGTSNTFGKNGYWQIRPTPNNGSISVFEAASAGNNLGTSASTYPTLWTGSNPSFMSSVQGYAGNYVNFGGYALYREPDGSTLTRQGALSISTGNGPYNTPSGTNNGFFGDSLSFALNYSGTVRLGFAVDSVADGNYAPDYLSVYSNSIGTTYSSLLTRDGVPDMAIFDIVNPAGETFYVAQWQLQGTNSVSALSLVTVDVIAVPEPSAGLLAAGGLMAWLCHRRRRA